MSEDLCGHYFVALRPIQRPANIYYSPTLNQNVGERRHVEFKIFQCGHQDLLYCFIRLTGNSLVESWGLASTSASGAITLMRTNKLETEL